MIHEFTETLLGASRAVILNADQLGAVNRLCRASLRGHFVATRNRCNELLLLEFNGRGRIDGSRVIPFSHQLENRGQLSCADEDFQAAVEAIRSFVRRRRAVLN